MDDSEPEVLLFFLNKMRNAVVRTSEGLTEAQLRAPGVASGTNILGLIQHLTGVEEYWFRMVFLGEDLAVEKSMQVPDGVSAADVVPAYRRASTHDQIVALPGSGPGGQGRQPRGAAPGGDHRSWPIIEETGRHAGHADILREQIDNVTGL